MVLTRFLPRDERFFEYFREAATNATDVANALVDLLWNYEDVERKVRKIRDLEHRGDEIAHRVFSALNRTFVTPIDREDIQDLTSKLDDFVDYIEEVTRRLWLYRIEEPTEQARLLARIIHEQSVGISEAVGLLEHPSQRQKMLRYTVEINRLENEGDDVLDQTLAGLYADAHDVPSLIQCIRWGEIYQLLEDATDRGEDVANALEGIVLKNA